MKQEIITYLSTLKDDIKNISNYLYNHPEQSFCEEKSYNYIVSLLKNKGFQVKENILDIPNSFIAQYGTGHPKICYICKYDSPCSSGHILGTNLVPSMSIGASLALSKVIPKIGGSVIVLGCPGEFSNGSLVSMTKDNIFEDLDCVLMAVPHCNTFGVSSSKGVIPIKITYSMKDSIKSNPISYDTCIFILNSINTLLKEDGTNCSISTICINDSTTPCIPPNTMEMSFYVKGETIEIAQNIIQKIKKLLHSLSDVINLNYAFNLQEVPCKNFLMNTTLNRIFAHNLKESGIINNSDPISVPYKINFGTVSHVVPCLYYFISIVDDKKVQYASEKFKESTLSSYAEDIVFKTCISLALTGLDFIQKPSLLKEAKLEIKNKKC